MDKLRELSFSGIPDEYPQLRSLVWKILLNHLSPKKEEWYDKLKNS